MDELLPSSLEVSDIDQGIDWSSIPGSSAVRCLLLDCIHNCYHGDRSLAEQEAEELLDVIWEKLNTGHWKDVKLAWRHAFSYCSLIKVICLYHREPWTSQNIKEALSACDRGLLLGAPVMGGVLNQLASCLHAAGLERCYGDTKANRCSTSRGDGDNSECSGDSKQSTSKRLKTSHHPVPTIQGENEIERLVTPSLHSFLVDYMEKGSPVIIEQAMDHWPARQERQWSLEYLRRIAGSRTVPVEIGAKYTDDSWSQKLMTLHDFISSHIDIKQGLAGKPKVGYLAQHQLFDQIPELKRDICIPDYCCLHVSDKNDRDVETCECDEDRSSAQYSDLKRGSDQKATELGHVEGVAADGEKNRQMRKRMETREREEERSNQAEDDKEEEEDEEDVDINAWFGPEGTVSPLHFDPKHNLLCQVVGQKYIRLYSKEFTPFLYTHDGILSNTSQVDVENVDQAKFPLFKQAPFKECILSEGEMVYIPPGCWHYVRSLSVSFSVSFWWR